MRYRSRTRGVDGLYHTEGFDASGAPTWNDTYYGHAELLLSQITDEPHGYGRQNTVSHSTTKIDVGGIHLPKTPYVSGGGYARVTAEGLYYSPPTIGSGPDFTSALQALLDDASGSMDSSVAAVVNAVEIKQLKSLVPGLLAGFKAIRKYKWSRKTWKELAGSHLAYSFGLAPLVSDFRNLLTIRQNVEKRIKELESRNGKVVRLGKRVTGPTETESVVTIGSPNGFHDLKWTTKFQSNSQGAISCDVRSFFVDSTESRAHIWADALSLSSPLTNVWELIPFSFVIDWFIPVGKKLRSIESKAGMHTSVMCVDCSNFSFSTKVEITGQTEIECVNSNSYPGWVGVKGKGSDYYSSVYIRQPGIPAVGFIGGPSGWSINRSALSISLIIQKVIK